jgi:spore germination protein KB
MQNQKVTQNQFMFSIVLFNFGSSVVMGVSTTMEHETWIAILVSTLMALPLFILYARLIQLFPEKNLFQIAELLFGEVGGKVISGLLVWYAIHLAALVLRNFSEFTQVCTMPETPQLPIMILMALTSAYLAKSGMKAIGKWSIIAFIFVLLVIVLTGIAAFSQMKMADLLPILSTPSEKVVQASFQIFSFPYAETVLILCLGDSLRRDAKSYKLFIWALMITMVFLLLVFIRNATVLGETLMRESYFPSYITVRIIRVGNFLERIESSVSSNFLLTGIVKITVCLLAASKGIASLFHAKNGAAFIFPVGMLALALCATLYHSIMEMFIFIDYYFYYAFPFQVIIPVVLWIAAEIHVRKNRE